MVISSFQYSVRMAVFRSRSKGEREVVIFERLQEKMNLTICYQKNKLFPSLNDRICIKVEELLKQVRLFIPRAIVEIVTYKKESPQDKRVYIWVFTYIWEKR